MSYYNNNNNSYEMSNFDSNASNPFGNNSYGNGGDGSYGNRYQNSAPYDSNYPPHGGAQAYVQHSGSAGFFDQVQNVNSEIEIYESTIMKISSTHKKILNEVDANYRNNLEKELDNATAQASQQQATIKTHIESIFKIAGGDSAREAQAQNVKENFMQSIQKYQSVEDSYRRRTKEQAMRQVYIVNPNISKEEANEVVETGGQQIFSDYLTNSNVRGQAQSALNEVEQRHRELLKIQKQMQELNQLFKEIEFLVAENHEKLEKVGERVKESTTNVDLGVTHVDDAIVKAKSSRKKKCWCLWISIIVIIIIIAIVVGVIVDKIKK